MSFPVSPANGQIATVNNIEYVYDSATNSWTIVPASASNTAFNHANAAFDAANTADSKAVTAGSYANSAFNFANGISIFANTPSHVANSSSIYANAAFAAANNEAGVNATQNTNIVLSFNQANAAFVRANNSLNANVGGTIDGDVTITGNLSILGNTVTYNVSTYVVNDPIIILANNNFSDIVDVGFAAHYSINSVTQVHTGLIRHAATDKYYLFEGYEPHVLDDNILDINDPSLIISTLRANIEADLVTVGNVNIKLYTDNAFNAANNEAGVNATQNTNIQYAWNHANAAYEQANVGGGGGTVTVSTFNATANGAQTTFEIGFSPVSAEAVQVTIDGLIQPETSYTANANANTITFLTAPTNGEQVRVLSFYTGASAYIINDGSITPIKLSAETNNYINTIATNAATVEALAMAAALAIALG